jgi:hypothetical protein
MRSCCANPPTDSSTTQNAKGEMVGLKGVIAALAPIGLDEINALTSADSLELLIKRI